MQQFFSLVAILTLISATVWAIPHLTARHRLAKTLARLALIMGLSLLLIGWWSTPVALAEVQFLKEADQWVYQVQHELIDTDNNRWEVTALKQMEAGSRGFYLRLTTRSQSVYLDAAQPLVLNTASGKQPRLTGAGRFHSQGKTTIPERRS